MWDMTARLVAKGRHKRPAINDLECIVISFTLFLSPHGQAGCHYHRSESPKGKLKTNVSTILQQSRQPFCLSSRRRGLMKSMFVGATVFITATYARDLHLHRG
jgi:hypothetical protein